MEEFCIPVGNSSEEVKQREDIIYSFYEQWKSEHPDQKVYNVNLKDDIHIRNVSIAETARHAAKRYMSTLAVLQLDAVLSCARKVAITKTENRENQKSFKAMMIMEYFNPGIGKVKLTVGIRHHSLLKVQYCITAIEI